MKKFIAPMTVALLFIAAYAYGTAILNPVATNTFSTVPFSCTPTISSATNVASSAFICHRQGKWLFIDGQVTWSGAGGAGNLGFTLPSSLVIDTAYLPGGTSTGNGTASNLGGGDSLWLDTSASAWRSIWPKYATTTKFEFWMTDQALSADQMSNGESINFRAKIPIVGWN